MERLQEIRGFKVETKASRLVVEVEISSGMRVKLQAKSCVVVGKNEIENSQLDFLSVKGVLSLSPFTDSLKDETFEAGPKGRNLSEDNSYSILIPSLSMRIVKRIADPEGKETF
ncbi:hypothetical protein NC652_040567 [Populus alba x Populus x berolinensis]|nr:hypothetical protein NC652_040567 [Populus alba x Populus x berolinensis]